MCIATVLAVAAAYGVFVDALGQDEPPVHVLELRNVSAPGALPMANDAAICTTWGGECTLSALSNDLKLGTTCAVNVPIPSDNYVADKRLNKNDNNGVASAKPFIQIRSDGPETSEADQVAWKTYQADPATAQSKITFNKPGVYDVSMTASDYNQETTCPGCVSVRDTFRPRFANSWLCDTPSLTTQTLSASSLGTFNRLETEFDTHGHVTQNNPNSGDDCSIYDEVWRPFTQEDPGTTMGQCFGAGAWSYNKQRLEASPFGPYLEFVQDEQPILGACSWSCFKLKTLGEQYVGYTCPSTSTQPSATCILDGVGSLESACNFGFTLEATGNDLATVQTASGNVIDDFSTVPADADATKNVYYGIPCTALDGSAACTYSTKLSDLITVTVSPKHPQLFTDEEARKTVKWRYNLDGSTWYNWDSTSGLDNVAFSQPSTTVSIEA